jgi:hypothetical protein
MCGMPAPRPRFQFSLFLLFVWMLAFSVLLGLANLPWPINVYFAPLYASAAAGYVGSRSPWMAAALGGLASVAASYLLMVVEAGRLPAPQRTDVELIPYVSACCCFPGGAYIGLATGVIVADRRNKRRFQSQLAALRKELGASRAKDEDSPPQT